MSSLIAIVPSFTSCKRVSLSMFQLALVPAGLAATAIGLQTLLDYCA